LCSGAARAITFTFPSNSETLSWIVPATGIYDITAWGGAGGASDGARGGLGDQLSASFMLHHGQRLFIAVGHNGAAGSGPDGGDGGGLAVVFGLTNDPFFHWYPMLVAAGGGGAGPGEVDGVPVGGSFLDGGNAGPHPGAGGGFGATPGGAAGTPAHGPGFDAPEPHGGMGGLGFLPDVYLDPNRFGGDGGFGGLGGGGGYGWLGGGGGAPGYGGGGGGSAFDPNNHFFPGHFISEGNTRHGPEVEIVFHGVIVPEPSTWSMLILGVGMVGIALRRRWRRNAIA
jgi:hypothetical protein